jgi:biopolymer transport protein ExbB
MSVAAALVALCASFSAQAQEAPADVGPGARIDSPASLTPSTVRIDPTTGAPYAAPLSKIDPSTGLLIDAVTLLPLPRPPVVDIATGLVRPDAPVLDAATGRLVDVATRRPVAGAPAIDPVTGTLINPVTGEPNPRAPVIDVSSGRLLPVSRIIDETTGVLMDPETLATIPAAPVYDPLTDRPLVSPIIDPVTGLEVPLPGEPGFGESPYGFMTLLREGGVVAQATLAVLFLMLSATWYIIFSKFIYQSQLIGQARRLDVFLNSPTIEDGVRRLRGSAFQSIARIADPNLQDTHHGIGGHIAPSARTALALSRSLEMLNGQLQGGMAVLATVGATAPFVGLFGTVMGIYNALVEIGVSGEPSIDKVAGPVGEALIMTALGLFVAVPAVFLYNVLGRRNKVIIDTARNFAAEVDALITSTAQTESRHGDVRAYARG